MKAASWLASPERKILSVNCDFDLVFDEKTGLDSFVPTGATINFDPQNLVPEVAERLLPLLEYASFVEVNFHLNRLLLHRRKASLGEASLPMFVDDLCGMLGRIGVTSLGMALLVEHLITSPRSSWFPEWPEIESAAVGIKKSILKIRGQVEQFQKKAQQEVKA